MKQSLQAVSKDSKIDIKTKDWELQSLQRAIQMTQQQISAQEAIAAPQKSEPSTGANDAAKQASSSGKRISFYA